MLYEQVPPDFPQEFLASVSGAQPKVLVEQDAHGRFVSSSELRRLERWEICFDLLEQLTVYVNKHVPAGTSAALYAGKVSDALELKRSGWGVSSAEAAWIGNELAKRFEAK